RLCLRRRGGLASGDRRCSEHCGGDEEIASRSHGDASSLESTGHRAPCARDAPTSSVGADLHTCTTGPVCRIELQEVSTQTQCDQRVADGARRCARRSRTSSARAPGTPGKARLEHNFPLRLSRSVIARTCLNMRRSLPVEERGSDEVAQQKKG